MAALPAGRLFSNYMPSWPRCHSDMGSGKRTSWIPENLKLWLTDSFPNRNGAKYCIPFWLEQIASVSGLISGCCQEEKLMMDFSASLMWSSLFMKNVQNAFPLNAVNTKQQRLISLCHSSSAQRTPSLGFLSGLGLQTVLQFGMFLLDSFLNASPYTQASLLQTILSYTWSCSSVSNWPCMQPVF